MGIFNKDTFLNTAVDKANDTVRQTVEAGVYEATITEVDVRNGEKDGKEWAALKLKLELNDEELKAKLKRDRIIVFYDFFIDLTDLGTIDTGEGKNVPLGKVRKAVGKNEGAFFPLELVGCRLLVAVSNKPVKDSLDGDMRNDVTSVAALS